MHTTAIVVAAGSGRRLGSKIPKPLVKLNRIPTIIYSLAPLSKHPSIKDIILVANRRNFKGIVNSIKRYRIKKIRNIVLGGKLRQDSVRSGLRVIDSCTELVLVHDAARPFIDKAILSRAIKAGNRYAAAVVGMPVKATIKEAAGSQVSVKKTLDRRRLWDIQTPQVFKKELILRAYNKFGKLAATDDAMLVEKMGVKVRIVPGSYKNIKITTPEDLTVAQTIAKKCLAV